jgi:threonine dehydratase
VYLSQLVPQVKVEAIRDFGADVVIAGEDQDQAVAAARARSTSDGLLHVPPFDHPAIICGQGSIGVEIARQLPDVATVIVPLSGGGLLAGVGLALKALRPDVTVVGVSTAACPAMVESLSAGHPVYVEERRSLADSLGGGIGLDNKWTLPIVAKVADTVHVIDESLIADGLRHAFNSERIYIEGAAACGIGLLLRHPSCTFSFPIVVLITGDAMDIARAAAILSAKQPGDDGRA